MKKKYDLTVVTGTYTNQQGETKKRYKNIGRVMSGDNGFFMLLDRTFNPAGVPNPDNRDMCLVSMFEPREKQTTPYDNTEPKADNFDDDIPF